MHRLAPTVAALFCLLLLLTSAGAEEEAAGTPLERALADPPATGLLVVEVVPESQAVEAGIEAGDVIVLYDAKETPDLDALRLAIQGAADKSTVVMKLVRAGGVEKEVTLAPGRIGVQLAPVTKGEGVDPLPPATDVTFDFSSLEGAPHDDWYRFELANLDGKRGFEHGTVRLEDGKVVARREVAFDGGEQWGLNHFDVTVTFEAGPAPKHFTWRFEAPLGGFVGEGSIAPGDAGTLEISFRARAGEEAQETGPTAVPDGPMAVPSYLVETLAAFMPREVGACLHFRPVTDSNGALGRTSALVCVGEGSVELDGESVEVWKYEQQTLMGTPGLGYWVDERGRVLRSDYGGAVATRATKEEALKDLHADLKPRTAD